MKNNYIPDDFENLDDFMHCSYRMFEYYQDAILEAALRRASEPWQNKYEHRVTKLLSLLSWIPLKLFPNVLILVKMIFIGSLTQTDHPANIEIIDLYSPDGVYWLSCEREDW